MSEYKKYELPKSWIWTELAEIGIVASGGTPSTKEPSYWGGKIPWISPADLTGYDSKYIAKGRKNITELGLERSSARLLPPESVLFSSRAPIGYVAIAKNEIATNQGFKNLITTKSLNSNFVYHYLKSAKQLAESMASGTTFLEISGTRFGQIPIPLPPFNEQQRIVDKIEELFSDLDNGIANLRLAQNQLKIYRQALLKHAFEGKLTAEWRKENNPEPAEKLLERIKEERQARYDRALEKWKSEVKQWEKEEKKGKKPLKPGAPKEYLSLNKEEISHSNGITSDWLLQKVGNVCEVKGGKRLPKGAKYVDEITEHPYLRVADFGDFRIDKHDLKYVSRPTHTQIERYTIQKEDTYISIAGTIGVTGVIQNDLDGANLTENAAKLTNQILLNNKYLAYFLGTQFAQNQIRLKTKATSQPKLALYRIEEIILPIPTLVEQEQIVNEIEAQFTRIDNTSLSLEKELIKTELTRQSILKKAFEGKLVDQDPKDEPASELLERIEIEKEKYLADSKKNKKKAPKDRKTMKKSLEEIILDNFPGQEFSCQDLKGKVDLSYDEIKSQLFKLIDENKHFKSRFDESLEEIKYTISK